MTDYAISSLLSDKLVWKMDLRTIIPLPEPQRGCHQGKIVHELILNGVLFPRNSYSYNNLIFFIEFGSKNSADSFFARLEKYLEEKWGQNS